MNARPEPFDIPERYNFTRDVIGELARTTPDRRGLLWVGPDGETVDRSFAELRDSAAKAASVLCAAGVGRGDTVLILMSRELEWWEVMLGCLSIGAIASPGSTQLTAKDIAYRASAAAATCVVATTETAPKVDQALLDDSIRLVIVGGAREGWLSYSAASAEATPLHEVAETQATDPALCYFTSGTVGDPKMTVHDQAYTLAHRITGAYWLDLRPGDLHWNLSDTGWAKAAWSSIFGPWQQGAAIFALHSKTFDPAKVMEILETFPITTLCAAPTAYRMLVRTGLAGRFFPSLRHCVSAGEPLNPEVVELWSAATGLHVYDGYGQTETVLLCGNRPGAFRLGSMGRPAPHFHLVVLAEDGAPAKTGQEGDVALNISAGHPPGLFKGYRDDAARTAAVFKKDWYLTGDRAIVDDDGYFWFVGRADDVILSSGYRIGPFEVESALFEHPAVAESAVVSSPDEVRGEVVKAFVILAKGYEPSDELIVELQQHVKMTTAPYKYPRAITFVKDLPKTTSGKIMRKDLRDREWNRAP